MFSESTFEKKTDIFYDIENSIDYRFDKNFNLIQARELENYKNTLDVFSIDETKVKQQIYDFLKPIIDYQNKPLINLQWLFNWLYQDELD